MAGEVDPKSFCAAAFLTKGLTCEQQHQRDCWLGQLLLSGKLRDTSRKPDGSVVLSFENLNRHELGNLLMKDPCLPDGLVRYQVVEDEPINSTEPTA